MIVPFQVCYHAIPISARRKRDRIRSVIGSERVPAAVTITKVHHHVTEVKTGDWNEDEGRCISINVFCNSVTSRHEIGDFY